MYLNQNSADLEGRFCFWTNLKKSSPSDTDWADKSKQNVIIEPVIRVRDKKFPLWERCDMWKYFSDFVHQIPSNLSKKTMGYMSQCLSNRWSIDIDFLYFQHFILLLVIFSTILEPMRRKNSNILIWINFELNYKATICYEIKKNV